MKSLFEEMGGTYTLGADGMYYPDLELPEEEPHYGKYGRMRLRYLKEHHKVLYNTLLLDGELVKHLNEVDDTAKQRMELCQSLHSCHIHLKKFLIFCFIFF